MEGVIFEFTVRATLVACGTQMVLWLLRVHSATALHRAWTAVVVVMLCLPLWTVWGPKVTIPFSGIDHSATAPPIFPEVDLSPRASPPLNELLHRSEESRTTRFWDWRTIGLSVYLLGAVTLLTRLAIGTLRTRQLIRGAREQYGQKTSLSCMSPITVGYFRPITIFPASWRDWPQAELSAVLAHEHEHVHRRDPLFQWLALFNRAIFWFHPLAWWLERRMSVLAEAACDTAALAQGHDPMEYCRYLLHIAESVTNAGKRLGPIGMRMPGGSLSTRIRQVLEGLPRARLSRTRMACVLVAWTMSTALFAGTRVGQDDSAISQPSFEVATIKPTAPDYRGGKFIVMQSTRHYVVRNYPVRDLISAAYDLPPRAVSGGPDWVNTDHYDIDALIPERSRPSPERRMLLLRALLADRFNLMVHVVQREMPVYELVVARGGARLQASAPDTEEFLTNRMFNDNHVLLPARNVTMAQFVSMLQRAVLDRPVLDKTGLTGNYNFDLEWTRDETQFGGIPTANVETQVRPDIFSALQQQLGLRLQSAKGLAALIVIDRVARPSPN